MGNFSRDTFDRLKHYAGVRLQQGVPLVDADWNELEDIRKYELQAYLTWYVGDGVPAGNDGFRITRIGGVADDFVITGGDGTADGAGRCLVSGWDVVSESDLNYSNQILFENTDLASAWSVSVLPALTVPPGLRQDIAYLDIWEREVDSVEDSDIINPVIGVETGVRLKREWVVRVAENTGVVPPAPAGHTYYHLARLERNAANFTVIDLRDTGLSLDALKTEIHDARGIKASLGNRLNESLTSGGQLRFNTVGHDQFQSEVSDRLDQALTLTGDLQPDVVSDSNVDAGAAIIESKILFNSGGHSHSGGDQGNLIGTSGLENDSVTADKISFESIASGAVADLGPGETNYVLVEADIDLLKGRSYLPGISISGISGSGTAQVTYILEYRASTSAPDNYDIYMVITNAAGGSDQVDVWWWVNAFAEE